MGDCIGMDGGMGVMGEGRRGGWVDGWRQGGRELEMNDGRVVE